MIEKIGVSDFRSRLKQCMDNVSEQKGNIIQIQNHKSGKGDRGRDLFVLSRETLTALQERHEVNVWCRDQLAALSLSDYMTLASGRVTGSFKLPAIIELSVFFSLAKELADMLACPGVKANACKWDVGDFMESAIAQEKKPEGQGPFNLVYNVIDGLYEPEAAKGLWEGERTLLAFFEKMAQAEPETLSGGLFTKEQRIPASEGLQATARGLSMLMEFQPLGTAEGRPAREEIVAQFAKIQDWHGQYAAPWEK